MRHALLLFSIALPALGDEGGGGGAGGDFARLERLQMARLAFDARLKLADLLREEGKRKEALRACEQAVAIFETALATAEAVGPAGGGNGPRARAADTPVERGLKWLAAHQDIEAGNWDSDEFMKHDPAGDRCDGRGAATSDVHATALATLAFLGAGYTDRGDAAGNPYAGNVRQALRFLIAAQNEDGSFVPAAAPQSLRGNAIAAVAMCEAFARTRNPRYRGPAEQGIAFLLKQRTPGAGWKDPAGRDASATAWCVAAIRSARFAGFEVPEGAFTDALAWVDSVTDRATGRVGGAEKPAIEAATAAGICTRIFCGQAPAAEAIRKGASLCVAKPPVWNVDDGTIDMDYWHWGTLALFQVGGEAWRVWSTSMKAAIVDRQQAAGSRTGSWDPVGADGRVQATALMALDLEAYYRYERAFGTR